MHRIGRTGRAGAAGTAISLVCPEEHERLAEIEKTIRIRMPRDVVPGFGHRSEAPLMEPPRRERRRGAEEDRLTRGRAVGGQRGNSRDEETGRRVGASRRRSCARVRSRSSAGRTSQAPRRHRRQGPATRPPGRRSAARQVAALLGGFVRKPG